MMQDKRNAWYELKKFMAQLKAMGKIDSDEYKKMMSVLNKLEPPKPGKPSDLPLVPVVREVT